MVTLGVVGFVVALLVSVTLHEAGHFFTARHYGMKASRFFIGFGPTLWSFRRGETEYGVKAIPAGGFVKIDGMTPLEDVAPGDENRAFWKFPVRQRAVVLAAGSFMHFVIALFLVYGIVLAGGLPESDPPVVGDISTCVPAKAGEACTSSDAAAPAASALKPGDRILAVNGQHVTTFEQVARGIRATKDNTLTLQIRRDGATQTVSLQPVVVDRASFDDPKLIAPVGAIGVAPGDAYKHPGPIAAIGATGHTLGQMLKATGTALTTKTKSLAHIYGKDRDPEGFAGVVGISRFTGDLAAAQDISVGHRIAGFFFIVAGVNMFVGLFNLLPLLPLDGGHLAIAGFEQVRDRLRRLRGYTGELRRVDLNKLMPITYAFVFLMIGLTLFIMGADILNPIRLNQ